MSSRRGEKAVEQKARQQKMAEVIAGKRQLVPCACALVMIVPSSSIVYQYVDTGRFGTDGLGHSPNLIRLGQINGIGRVAPPFGFALTDPYVRFSRIRLFPKVTPK